MAENAVRFAEQNSPAAASHDNLRSRLAALTTGGFPMLRLSTLTAALALIASATFATSPAQAVVCSYDVCVSRCFTGGGKFCLRGCDRRIARRMTSGLCPWYGQGMSMNRQASLGAQ
jgi:hypothetical protein